MYIFLRLTGKTSPFLWKNETSPVLSIHQHALLTDQTRFPGQTDSNKSNVCKRVENIKKIPKFGEKPGNHWFQSL